MTVRRWWRRPRVALMLLAALIVVDTTTLTLHPIYIPGFVLGVILVVAVFSVLDLVL